ncbi:CC0125/CC1285 family lipoprotein [Marinimicrobium locisalis]|uniref:CC0125/CC1285 family lipoprotein n=1 Tax=Marinimicrobium locisalis TaxID=546022 RepID=UPI00322146EC
MKKPMAVLMMLLLISACAGPVYQPAKGGGYGYRESQVADNRYRVSFTIRGDNRFEAMDYALLRASELTLMAGYDWFVVVDRQVDGTREESGSRVSARRTQSTERHCGLLGCTTSSSPSTAYGAEIRSGDRSEQEVILEIRLGKGIRPTEGDSYDALEVRDNLRKRVE